MKFSVMGFGLFVRAVTQFTVLIVSSRLFSASDIGVAVILFAVIHLLWPWFEVALGQTYLHIDKLDNSSLENLSFIKFCVSCFSILSAALLLPVIKKISGNYDFVVVAIFVSIILLRSYSAFSQYDLLKRIHVRKFVVIEQISYVLGFFLALSVCYFCKLSELYLILGFLFYSFFSAILYSYCGRVVIKVRFEKNRVRDTLSLFFGFFLGSGLNTVVRELNTLLVGFFLGAAAAAYYNRAYQLYMVGTATVGQVYDKLLTPIFQKNNNEHVENGDLFELASIVLFSFFLLGSAFVFLNTERIVVGILGSDWVNVAPILSILAFAIAMRTAMKVNEAVLRAYGLVYSRVLFYLTWVLVLVLGAIPASYIGVVGFAFTEAAGAILFWFLSTRASLSLVKKDWYFLYTCIVYGVLTIVVYVMFHFSIARTFELEHWAQLLIDILVVLALSMFQILLIIRMRFGSYRVIKTIL